MPKTDTEGMIAEVFRLTGTKITDDDPILAVLLLQQQILQTELAAFGRQQGVDRKAFLEDLAAHERIITEAAAELREYRQQILTELLQKTEMQQEEMEAKLFASIQNRVAENNRRMLDGFFGRLTKHLWLVFLVLAAAVLVGVFVGR